MKRKFFTALYAAGIAFSLCATLYGLFQSIIILLNGTAIGLFWLISAVFFGVLSFELTDV